MPKKLSDINLRNKRRAEAAYNLSQNAGATAGERENAWQTVNKPPFKSFLQDIIDKKNQASGGTANVQPIKGLLGGTVKDPEPPTEKKEDPINNDTVIESLKKTFEKLRDILKLKRKNSRLRSNINKRKVKPGDTARKRLGLGTIGKVAKAIVPVNMLGALGDLIGLAVLNWLGNPKNKQAVQNLVKIFTGIIKFLSWFITGTINNLFGGFNQLISGGSIAEKLVGFVKMFAGLVGLRWLMNPFQIVKDIIWGFNRLKKWPEILTKLFKGGSRKSIDAVFQKHNSLLRTSLTRTLKRAFLRIFGTFGKKILRTFVKPIVSKVSAIPFIGPIIAFLVNWIVFKEPPGRAAFKAVGAGFGMFLAGTAGSVIPILGTWVGAALGGIAGDWIGGAFYDILFGGGDGKPGVMAGLTNAAGSLISWAWKIVKGIGGAILNAPVAIAKGVINTGKNIVGGAKKAAGWFGNKAKGVWNWMTGGDDEVTSYQQLVEKGGVINDHGNVGGDRLVEVLFPPKKKGLFGRKTEKRRALYSSSSEVDTPIEEFIDSRLGGGDKKEPGGGEENIYTEPEVKTLITNAVSETSQVSQMSKDFEIEKKVRERRIKTRATLVAIQNRKVNTINVSGSPDRDDLNTSISDLLVLSRI